MPREGRQRRPPPRFRDDAEDASVPHARSTSRPAKKSGARNSRLAVAAAAKEVKRRIADVRKRKRQEEREALEAFKEEQRRAKAAKKARRAEEKAKERAEVEVRRVHALALRAEKEKVAAERAADRERSQVQAVLDRLLKEVERMEEKEERQQQRDAERAERDAERARSAAQRAIDKELEAALNHLSPSDLAGKTTTARGFLELVRAVAREVRDGESGPLPLPPRLRQCVTFVEMEPVTDELLALAELWRALYAAAWDAAAQHSDAVQKRTTFAAALGPLVQAQLFEAAQRASTAPRSDLGPVMMHLQGAVRSAYVALNSPPQPEEAEATTKALDGIERGIVSYCSAWAVRQVLGFAQRHHPDLLPALQALVETREVPEDAEIGRDDLLFESRELHGGLLRVKPPVSAAFEAVEMELRSTLTMERLLMLREQVVEVAAERVSASERVIRRFDALFDSATASQRKQLRVLLTVRYLHMRAKAFARHVMQEVGVQEKGMAVRTALKACMVHAHIVKKE